LNIFFNSSSAKCLRISSKGAIISSLEVVLLLLILPSFTSMKTSDNGVFFFREKYKGIKKQFLDVVDKLPFGYNEAGNIAITDFIKKYKKRINK